MSPTCRPCRISTVLTELRPSFTLTRDRFGVVRRQLEQADGAVGLAMHGPADVEHVFQVFELDGAVDAEVGSRAQRQRVVDADVDGNGAVHNRGIDARSRAL